MQIEEESPDTIDNIALTAAQFRFRESENGLGPVQQKECTGNAVAETVCPMW
jgi:hypothetical protein